MPHKLKNMRIMLDQVRNLVWALVAEVTQKESQLGEYGMVIAILATQITKQTAQITSKDGEIQALTDELASLKARMSKDSHNSSKPPSTDGLQKRTTSLRKPSGSRQADKKATRDAQ